MAIRGAHLKVQVRGRDEDVTGHLNLPPKEGKLVCQGMLSKGLPKGRVR